MRIMILNSLAGFGFLIYLVVVMFLTAGWTVTTLHPATFAFCSLVFPIVFFLAAYIYGYRCGIEDTEKANSLKL